MKRATLILAPLALAACTKPAPVLILPPAELAVCKDEPEPPALPARDGSPATDMARDLAMLDYVLGLRSAWGDCRAKVGGLATWRDEAQKKPRH